MQDDDARSVSVRIDSAQEMPTVTGGPLAGATLPAAEIVDQKKPVVAGYDLVRAIGRGGMGVVWEAVEHRFDRRVAVKVQQSVLQTAATRDELWAEAFVAARIGDPGIVRVLDVGVTLEEHPYSRDSCSRTGSTFA